MKSFPGWRLERSWQRGECFSPTIMLNGRIIGFWKKSMKKNVPQITLTFFEKMPKKIVALFRPEIERLEKFYTQF